MSRNAIESEFRTPKMADRTEMARNVIENDFRTSKMAAEKINHIDLKWPEMHSKVIFGHPKWPTVTILSKLKVPYRSEMARNAIESDFRTSKMTASGHFEKKIHKNKKCGIDLKW